MAKFTYEIPPEDKKRSMRITERNANVLKGYKIDAGKLERKNDSGEELFSLMIQPDNGRRILLPMDRNGMTVLTARLITLLGTEFIVAMNPED